MSSGVRTAHQDYILLYNGQYSLGVNKLSVKGRRLVDDKGFWSLDSVNCFDNNSIVLGGAILGNKQDLGLAALESRSGGLSSGRHG